MMTIYVEESINERGAGAPLNYSVLLGNRSGSLAALVRFGTGEGDCSRGISDLEPGKAPHGDVLAEFADLGGNELRNVDGLILDEGLLQQADLLVELFHHAGNHLLGDVCRLAASDGLREIDV